jgi:hypothetical protein
MKQNEKDGKRKKTRKGRKEGRNTEELQVCKSDPSAVGRSV